MFTVTTVRDEIVIATVKTESAAIRAGRKHQREVNKMGGCAEGFNVYDESGKPARYQRCNNVGECWKDVKSKQHRWM